MLEALSCGLQSPPCFVPLSSSPPLPLAAVNVGGHLARLLKCFTNEWDCNFLAWLLGN